MKIGFDNEKYLKMQSEHIRDRISKFDNKLYLEFGGKLFDDYHASRVLPGFAPDSKLRLLKELSDQAEIVIVISAKDIEKNKIRGDLGITYDTDVLRLIHLRGGGHDLVQPRDLRFERLDPLLRGCSILLHTLNPAGDSGEPLAGIVLHEEFDLDGFHNFNFD